MGNILSIVTFIPALAALILAVFLRGDDAAAQRNAKCVALVATTVTCQLARMVSGMMKVVSRTNSTEMPSTPILYLSPSSQSRSSTN